MKSVSSSFRLAVIALVLPWSGLAQSNVPVAVTPTNVASAPAAPSVHQNLAILPVSRTGGAVGRQS